MKQKVVIAVMMLFTLPVVHAPQVLFSEGMIFIS